MILHLILLAGIVARVAPDLPWKSQKQWTYTILSLVSSSDNEKILKFDLRVARIGRGLFGITGELMRTTEFTDKDFIEFESFYSSTGSNNYKRLPFKIPKQTFKNFMETTYRKMIMSSVTNCSNFGEGWPLYANTVYYMDKCQISNEACPSYMKAGYYKVFLKGTGEVSYTSELIVEVESLH